ncbi:MAG: glycosyltransferase family 2 protein [Candidatus Omnitrophica bacterium]|nr:glycosyltransferase family 2 protein [Candidatus Omnitrophota bacterium]
MIEEKKPRISVVIPAKNEAPTIRNIILEAKKYAYEILVVDGLSGDDTRAISRNEGARVCQDSGRGKGIAIRLGIEKARGDIIVFMDADGSHDPKDIPHLVQPIADGKADMVIASRGKGGSDELQGDMEKTLRLLGSVIINLIINIRWRQKLTDVQNGFRAIKTNMAQTLNLRENITTIEQEMVMKALKLGFKIEEIPSHEYARKTGVSAIVLSKVWLRYIFTALKYLF